MKYTFAVIAIISAVFTFLVLDSEINATGLGIVSAGFSIATALMWKK